MWDRRHNDTTSLKSHCVNSFIRSFMVYLSSSLAKDLRKQKRPVLLCNDDPDLVYQYLILNKTIPIINRSMSSEGRL